MDKKPMIIPLYLLILLSCNKYHTCVGIKDGKYSGYGVVFYHKPVTGSSYELIMVPTCNDSIDLIGRVKAGKLTNMLGVSIDMNSRNPLFDEVYRNSAKFRFLNNDSLAPEFRLIYVCAVNIQFDNADNDTKLVTHLSSDILTEKIVFEDSSEISLKYFIATEVRITELRVLK
jgi:hypothetical protein